jgi:M6 family metalloprotease-like protein
MKLNFSALLAAAALCISLAASAVPAKRDKHIVTQPDGTTLTIYKIGDEHCNYTLTADNKFIVKDANGQYSYANIDTDGMIISSNVKAIDAAVRPAAHAAYLHDISDIDEETVTAKRLARPGARTQARALGDASTQSGMGVMNNFPTKGKIKGLIILVQFQDTVFHADSYYKTNAKDYFTNMMKQTGFSEYGGTGCAEEYFKDQSMGQYTPEFTVVGPYTVSQKASYYGGNDMYGYDLYPEQMVSEACQLADKDVNFADYDNDGDGNCDYVFVFYAGQGAATYGGDDTIWPHASKLSYGNCSITLDNVTINSYACTNEWENNRPDGVGTFVHEFSHVMGLPDLYNTTNSAVYYTPCYYSVLDYGPYNNDGCTPPNYTVFERNAMGWIDLKVLDGADSYELDNISTNDGCIAQTTKSTEFYLFENRQLTGWDKYLPGHGMLIWHIDYVPSYWTNNQVNTNQSHQYVDIVEANNQTSSYSPDKTIMAGWTWPGTSNVTSFTSTTTPAFKDWNGNAINLPITNIAEANGIISFDVLGGSPSKTPVPFEEEKIEKGNDYFVAQWSSVDEATDYKIWVYGKYDAEQDAPSAQKAPEILTETADMGSGSAATLPTGWTSSSLGSYTSTSNCGAAAPSAKMSADGNYIQTRQFDEEVVGVQFWMKGVGTDTNSQLLIEGYANNAWVTLATLVPTNNGSSTYTVSDIPDGVKQVKFTFKRSKGNIAIDDIVITLKQKTYYQVLPDFDGVLTNGATSVRVNKTDGCTEYRYQVSSTPDGSRFSKVSDYAYVTLSGTNGVDYIISTSDDAQKAEYYNMQGIKVSNPTPGLYIVRKGNTASKVVVR